MQEIRCPHCGKEIELSEALTKDIEATVLKTEQNKHRQEIETLRSELEAHAQEEVEQAKKKASEQAQKTLGLELQQLREESAEHKEGEKTLREQLLQSSKELRKA